MADRIIIQVATDGDRLFAVCEDGTLWVKNSPEGPWAQIAPIPEAPTPTEAK